MPGSRKSTRLALSPCAKPSPPLRTGDTKFSPSSSFCPRVFPMGLWKARTTAPKPLCARGMAIAIATICVYVFYWGMSHELFANFPRKDGEPSKYSNRYSHEESERCKQCTYRYAPNRTREEGECTAYGVSKNTYHRSQRNASHTGPYRASK